MVQYVTTNCVCPAKHTGILELNYYNNYSDIQVQQTDLLIQSLPICPCDWHTSCSVNPSENNGIKPLVPLSPQNFLKLTSNQSSSIFYSYNLIALKCYSPNFAIVHKLMYKTLFNSIHIPNLSSFLKEAILCV